MLLAGYSHTGRRRCWSNWVMPRHVRRCASTPNKQSLANGGAESQTLSAPYQQWVNEDVLWIITPEERAQFMALSTNDERDEFIRQFWQRRDAGMPGVDANSFRGEHIVVWPMQTSTSRPICLAGRQIGDVFTSCMGRQTPSMRMWAPRSRMSFGTIVRLGSSHQPNAIRTHRITRRLS